MFLKLYHNFQKQGKKVRLLGIAISNLNSECDEQLGLFDAANSENQKIDQVIDLVQDKFGPDLIKKASLLGIHSRRVGNRNDDE